MSFKTTLMTNARSSPMVFPIFTDQPEILLEGLKQFKWQLLVASHMSRGPPLNSKELRKPGGFTPGLNSILLHPPSVNNNDNDSNNDNDNNDNDRKNPMEPKLFPPFSGASLVMPSSFSFGVGTGSITWSSCSETTLELGGNGISGRNERLSIYGQTKVSEVYHFQHFIFGRGSKYWTTGHDTVILHLYINLMRTPYSIQLMLNICQVGYTYI